MPPAPHLQQHPDQIVQLAGWELDEEFPIAPQGAKPKRIFVCPNPPPQPFLIGGHRYLFKEPTGPHAQQVWSEIIAYELSRDAGVVVPPAFLAEAPGNRNTGVLVEFFYGYQNEPVPRFVHAIERLQGLHFPTDQSRGSLKNNIDLCRLHRVPQWRNWWAQTLAFDALIGNTDRHTENWGFLVDTQSGSAAYRLAPVFDNGTSLGFIIREEDLVARMNPIRFRRFLGKGRHHYGWIGGDQAGSQHVQLCQTFGARFPDIRGLMRNTVAVSDSRISRLVTWCSSFPSPLVFSAARGEFVAAQLRARRDLLKIALGG